MSQVKRQRVVYIVMALLMLAFLLWVWPRGSEANDPKKDHTPAALPVKVAPVAIQTIPQTVKSLGTLSAPQVVTISAEADGRITAIHFKNGQQVGEGMPIVQMDNSQAQANYDSAVAAWKLAVTKYNRSKLLVNQAISQQELANLKADMDSKHADVKKAQATLNATQISAPFSGVLGQFEVQQGDFVKAGSSIVNLVNTEQLRVDYDLSEARKSELKLGQLVAVTTSAYPKKTFYGTVSFISPTVSEQTRSIAVEAMIPNKQDLLSPGMFVHVAEQIGKIQNAIVIPDQAVQADLKGYYVYQIKNNHAVKTYIQAGQHMTGTVQVVSGLQKGDEVIIEGQQNLDDGSLVKVLQ